MPSTSQHLLIWTPSGAITNKLHIKRFVRWIERRQAVKWAVKNIIYCYLLEDVWVYKVNVVIQAGCEHCCAVSIFWQKHVLVFYVPLKSRFTNFPLGFFICKEIRNLSTVEAGRCIAEKTEQSFETQDAWFTAGLNYRICAAVLSRTPHGVRNNSV